ncbi:MAG: alanine--glyoxylate aminotransferase family protein [Bacillota bacterium]
MTQQQYLMIPGPTPVPPAIALAEAAPMINHRGPEFGQLLSEVSRGLQYVLRTENSVLVFPSAGTGAMEAAAANLVAPGERVLVAVAGEFGARFADIFRVMSADVTTIEVEQGWPVDPHRIGEALKVDPSIKMLVVTHNETSTGVTMDIPAIRSVIPRDDVIFIVDAISSAGAINLQTDEWGVDVVVAASQKALMCPPGLAMVAVSQKAWDKVSKTPCRSVYWSFAGARRFLERPSPQTPYTPAVSLLYALRESLRKIQSEGLDSVFERHWLVARAVRSGIRALGFETLAKDEWASNTVTAVTLPAWLDGHKLLGTLRQRYGVILAGGMGPLTGRIFRIGHVGFVGWSDVIVTLAALEMACHDLGGEIVPGRAVAAAESVFTNQR